MKVIDIMKVTEGDVASDFIDYSKGCIIAGNTRRL